MTIVDTSVWIDHLRHGDDELSTLLDEGMVLIHPYVLGEIACGSLAQRETVLGHLRHLPEAPLATESEVHHLLERHRLQGRGLGWIDLHLLASARLAAVPLVTRDRALREAAQSLLA